MMLLIRQVVIDLWVPPDATADQMCALAAKLTDCVRASGRGGDDVDPELPPCDVGIVATPPDVPAMRLCVFRVKADAAGELMDQLTGTLNRFWWGNPNWPPRGEDA